MHCEFDAAEEELVNSPATLVEVTPARDAAPEDVRAVLAAIDTSSWTPERRAEVEQGLLESMRVKPVMQKVAGPRKPHSLAERFGTHLCAEHRKELADTTTAKALARAAGQPPLHWPIADLDGEIARLSAMPHGATSLTPMDLLAETLQEMRAARA